MRGDIQGGSGSFGPTLASYRVSVARGITEQLDISLAASAVRVRAPEPGNPHGGIYTLRAGVKYAPVRFVALSYGLAPGGSVGGSFLAQDAGLTLGGENPYLVPFTAVHGLLSTPLRARTVRILYTDDEDDDAPPSEQGPDVYLEKPRLTWGWQLLLGLKLPLWRDPAFSAVPERRVRPSFTCTAGVTALSTKRAGDLYFTSGCAVEVTF